MNSPFNLSNIIVALMLGVAAYLSTLVFSGPSAILLAVVAIVSSLIGAAFAGQSTESSEDDEVKTLYVGNLPYRANEAAVRALFEQYGKVSSVRLMKDKQTGKRRGFGFVEIMTNDLENIIDSLNDTEFQQRTLKVREAKERPEGRNSED